jgi:hypothetical protein
MRPRIAEEMSCASRAVLKIPVRLRVVEDARFISGELIVDKAPLEQRTNRRPDAEHSAAPALREKARAGPVVAAEFYAGKPA